MELDEYLRPDNYEVEEWSRPDELALFTGFWSRANGILDRCPQARVADICCGTGLSLLGVESHPNLHSADGVDIDAERVRFARNRLSHNPRLSFHCEDAWTWLSEQRGYDVVLLSSAYHHIEHGKQGQFAQLVFAALKAGGTAVLAENIVPHFDQPMTEPYFRAVTEFYEAAHREALRQRPGLPHQVASLITENVELARRGEIEFKICRQTFVEEITRAGFLIAEEIKMWPNTDDPLRDNAGNFVFVLRKPG